MLNLEREGNPAMTTTPPPGSTRTHANPALVISILALVTALVAPAVAQVATSALSKGEKRVIRKIANRQINKRAPGLSVARANSADAATSAGTATTANTANTANDANTVDGANASDLKTSSAFAQESGSRFITETHAAVPVFAEITTRSAGRILATGSVEVFGDGNDVALCSLSIDNDPSGNYEAAPDDIGVSNPLVIAINHAVTRPAGTYAVVMGCSAVSGALTVSNAALNVYGLGT
ncbi:MAG TPA: hypothetical protein VFZ41_06820 [Solirubrobacterales bacterium]